jgi:hypothetical protein
MMSIVEGIRPAREEDLSAIVSLFGRVYPQSGISVDKLNAHLRRVLFEHPWRSERLSSLGYWDQTGRLIGFLGVLPRPMTAGGRPITMAVGHHFMVDREQRGTLAALHLLRAFVSGDQHLSICESGGDMRKLWHAVGGTTSLLQSPSWTRLLRPLQYFASRMKSRSRMGKVVTALSPACWMLDRLAVATRLSPYRLTAGDWIEETIGAEALISHIDAFSEQCHLRPRYDVAALAWLLDIIRAKRSFGNLEVRLLRHVEGHVLGYYLYFTKRGDVGQVLQVGARIDVMGDVLHALAVDAWRHGVVALTGRLDPRYLSEMSGASSFKHTGNWLLVHTRERTLERAIHMGDAFLTRLESEWWLPFHE